MACDATYFATMHVDKNVNGHDLATTAPDAPDSGRPCVPLALESVPRYQLTVQNFLAATGHVAVKTAGSAPDFWIRSESGRYSETGAAGRPDVLLRFAGQRHDNPARPGCSAADDQDAGSVNRHRLYVHRGRHDRPPAQSAAQSALAPGYQHLTGRHQYPKSPLESHKENDALWPAFGCQAESVAGWFECGHKFFASCRRGWWNRGLPASPHSPGTDVAGFLQPWLCPCPGFSVRYAGTAGIAPACGEWCHNDGNADGYMDYDAG